MRHTFMTAVFLISTLRLTAAVPTPSFPDFDARARAGDRLNVVFFGASLTWGANASDQSLTSYRARLAEKLEAAYPKAHFKFYDAAIGGTGSNLGVFRLQRDVLRHAPDLVFLDFSANDDIYSATPDLSASYESLVRRLILECHCPVVQVLFPFGWNVKNREELTKMKRRDIHLGISRAYHTAAGDAIALALDRIDQGTVTINQIWPYDKVHPGDVGYQLFADAAWIGFETGLKEKLVCQVPEKMLYADTFMTWSRVRLSSLVPLPAGWRVDHPSLTASYHDAQMTRWLDDVVEAANRLKTKTADGQTLITTQTVDRLSFRVNAVRLTLFGESTPTSGKFRLLVDGKVQTHVPWGKKEAIDFYDPFSKSGGNTHFESQPFLELDPAVDHTIEIEPMFVPDQEQQLRLESICVAGGAAKVTPVAPSK